MVAFVVVVFALTYLGMALGRVPGLKLDRSGIALVAAVVLIAADAVPGARVVQAIHFPTVLLLFALMIVSARFAAAGFYDACAAWIARREASPGTLLALTVTLGGVLSAVLVNDVVVFVMTPLLCAGLAARGRDVRPYLAGLAGAANAGSAATLIGNPQNIVIGQVGHLDFLKFVAVCAPPALVALLIVFVTVRIVWHRELRHAGAPTSGLPLPACDRGQTIKAAVATIVLLVMFATPLDRDMSALLVAAVLLLSRRFASRDMLAAVDWPLLILFVGLFVVNDAFAATGLGGDALAWLAANDLLPDRLALMAPLMIVLSNTIGNVPAVMALLAIWHDLPEGALYALALLSTLAGNFFLVGSIANLIVAERAAQVGQSFGFLAHARAGIPMTLLSLAAAGAWLHYGGWLGW